MDSPDMQSQKNAALTAALSSPSGEMSQVLTQMIKSHSASSSPISPVINLPAHSAVPPDQPNSFPVTPKPSSIMSPETFLAFSQAYRLFHTPSPRQEGTGLVTPTPATAAPKPVIELDLSSPQNDVPESPLIFKQEKIAAPEQTACSVSSLLDQDLSNCNRQPTIPSSFTEFETYNQQKFTQVASQSSVSTGSPMSLEHILSDGKSEEKFSKTMSRGSRYFQDSDSMKSPQARTPETVADRADTLAKTPIYDLSRPITGQCVEEHSSVIISEKMSGMKITSSGGVPMEIPRKPSTPAQGDFTLLGMEFETAPEVLSGNLRKCQRVPSADADSCSSSPQLVLSQEWNESDFKFVKSENAADSFSCSQLEIPFSQLDSRSDSLMSVSQSDSQRGEGISPGQARRSDSPSTRSLKARGYRTRASISRNMTKRAEALAGISKTMKWCKKKIKLCKSIAVYKKMSDNRMEIRNKLMECNQLMGEVKVKNRRDHERAQLDCNRKITPKVYPLLMSELEEELNFLTKMYLTYRNIVFKLRELYCESKPDISSDIKPGMSDMKPTNPASRRKSAKQSGSREAGKENKDNVAVDKSLERGGRKISAEKKKQPYKREALCVIQGGVVSEKPARNRPTLLTPSTTTQLVQQTIPTLNTPHYSSTLPSQHPVTKYKPIKPKPEPQYQTVLVSQNSQPVPDTSKHSPKGGVRSPKVGARSPRIQTAEQKESQMIVENFFKEQKIKIERGEYSFSQPRLQNKLSGNSPTLPPRVRELRGDIRSPNRHPKLSASSTSPRSPVTPPPNSSAPTQLDPIFRTSNSSAPTQLDPMFRTSNSSAPTQQDPMFRTSNSSAPTQLDPMFRTSNSSAPTQLDPMFRTSNSSAPTQLDPMFRTSNSSAPTQLDPTFRTPSPRARIESRDVGTITPDSGGIGRSSLSNTATMLPCYPYPSPAVKEIKIRNVMHKTSEQIVSRVNAHQALDNLQTIHLSPIDREKKRKEVTPPQIDTLTNYAEVAEKVLQLNSQNSTEGVASSPVPVIPLPSEENATVDSIVKFLIQQKRISTGYNALYTVLDNEKIYGSLDENGLTVSGDVIYKSCGQWIRTVHKLPALNIDSLRMVFGTDSGRSLHSEIDEYWKMTERADSMACEKAHTEGAYRDRNEDPNSDGFHAHRDGLDFFDIVTLLEQNVEMRMVELEEYIPCKDLDLPPHFWLVEQAGVPASILADIDDWPEL